MKFLPSGLRRITIPGGLLTEDCWLPPEETRNRPTSSCSEKSASRYPFGRCDRKSWIYREQLGVVIAPREDEPLLARGIHPAERGRFRSVWRSIPSGNALGRGGCEAIPAHKRIGFRGRNPLRLEGGEAHRSDRHPGCLYCEDQSVYPPRTVRDVSMVQFDELSFALDRESGRILS